MDPKQTCVTSELRGDVKCQLEGLARDHSRKCAKYIKYDAHICGPRLHGSHP